ncbi:hypothetical protein B0H12DRAFT_483365 [Mycena haematopus]|nr:hypothetical protein B0H12DRAFT_483365 [Mycena haematopus]
MIMELDLDIKPCNSDRSVAQYKKLTLESACSVRDLLVAVRDVVKILRELFREHQILHKHIDYSNISIRDSDDGVKGVVIDLDFPDMPGRILGSSRSTGNYGSLCLTLAFHSVGLLRDRANEREHEHTIQDDLESVFYVLCWACYGYDHKGRTEKFRPDWTENWKERHGISSAWSYKRTFLACAMTSHVNRYMGCQRDILENAIEQLRLEMDSPSDDPEESCTAIMEILEEAIEESMKEGCGTTLECSKTMRSANGIPR